MQKDAQVMPNPARRQAILDRVRSAGYAEAKQLAVDFGVDTSTIRRDLDVLAREGRVRRTHGGAALLMDNSSDVPYELKQGERIAEKRAIAQRAAALVRDGETIILDSGSTAYEVAVALSGRRDLTVITNDLRIGNFIATQSGTRLLVTGGEALGSVYTLVGERTVSFLQEFVADWSFLGADAIHPINGITNTNTLEIPVKRAMLAASTRVVVLADSAKFGNRLLARVCGLDALEQVITDDGLPAIDAKLYPVRIDRVSVI